MNEHGIAGAVYQLQSDGEYWPTLICTCGVRFHGDNWEDAGAYFDEHLEEEAGT